MKPEETLFCSLMDFSLHPDKKENINQAMQEEIVKLLPELIHIADLHNLLPALYDSLCQLEIPLSPDNNSFFLQRIPNICYGNYDMLGFTKKVIAILSSLPITFYVLKGVTLLSSYPKMEYRKYGDVDILVPEPQEYKMAKKHLLSLGFVPKKDLVDHHLELQFYENNMTYLLELHSKVIASQANRFFNEQLEHIYRKPVPVKETFADADLTFPMLPHTENALYLLLHMLQHFLSAGFGIKLLYDWTAYLEHSADKISFPRLNDILSTLGLTGFCNAITLLCKQYLGLPPQIAASLTSNIQQEETFDELMEDILSAGEFGKTDAARLLVMQKGGVISQYLYELHRQMKNRFQKAHKIFLLWPFLWLATGICFLWNNHFLRKIKTSALLATTQKRQRLLRSLNLFDTKQAKRQRF